MPDTKPRVPCPVCGRSTRPAAGRIKPHRREDDNQECPAGSYGPWDQTGEQREDGTDA